MKNICVTNNEKEPYEEMYRIIVFGPYASIEDGEILCCMPPDAKETVAWVIDNHPSLTERERKATRARFVDGKTYDMCGREFGVTRERVRQLIAKACRKMSYGKRPLYKMILTNGIGMYNEVKADYEAFREEEKNALLEAIAEKDIELNGLKSELESKNKEADDALNISIEECDFSVRTYNCLKRANISNVSELRKVSENNLMKMRNMGNKSVQEIKRWFREKKITAECNS